MKTHWAIQYQAYGETRVRSLCGRSSSFALDLASISTGQNITAKKDDVTCAFCLRFLAARPDLLKG